MLKKEEALKGVKLFVLDMDGTVYLGNQPIKGAFEFIREIEKSRDKDYIFFTNNASRVPAVYVEKLHKLGLDVDESKVVTAGDVCAEFLKTNYPNARIYLNGTRVLEENWKDRGIQIVKENPDVVVQSFDTTLTYHKLDRICHYIRNGAPFIATHMDTNCPTEYGFMPDCGAMCSLITDSTGVKPRFLGKPWKETVEMITKITGYLPEEMAFVGDRLYTDVATGVNNGAKGFLVLTGEATMQTVEESEIEPTCIYDSLDEMRKYLYDESFEKKGGRKMKVVFGCDPNATEFKKTLMEYVKELGHEVIDFGSDDPIYANTAIEVAKAVASKKYDRGVLVCGTGIGVSIAANKVKGAYAACIHDVYQGQRAELSNHANIITMGSQVIGVELAKQLVKEYLSVEWDPNCRSVEKVQRIIDFENEQLGNAAV